MSPKTAIGGLAKTTGRGEPVSLEFRSGCAGHVDLQCAQNGEAHGGATNDLVSCGYEIDSKPGCTGRPNSH